MVAGKDWTYVGPNGIVHAKPGEGSPSLAACETRFYSLADIGIRKMGTQHAAISYRATVDQICDNVKSPTTVYVLSIWQRRDGKLQLVTHSEPPIARTSPK